MNILQTCLPHLSDIATVPWEIQKKSFSTVLFIHTSDYSRYLTSPLSMLFRFFQRLYNVRLYHSRRGAGVTEWLDRYSDRAN